MGEDLSMSRRFVISSGKPHCVTQSLYKAPNFQLVQIAVEYREDSLNDAHVIALFAAESKEIQTNSG